MDLIVHVGLPKTGTTTLQRHAFPSHTGYMGRFIGNKEREDAGKRLHNIMRGLIIGSEEADAIREWCDQVYVHGSRIGSANVVVSEERISGINDINSKGVSALDWNPRRIAQLLSWVRDSWSKYGNVWPFLGSCGCQRLAVG